MSTIYNEIYNLFYHFKVSNYTILNWEEEYNTNIKFTINRMIKIIKIENNEYNFNSLKIILKKFEDESIIDLNKINNIIRVNKIKTISF